jgi:hypothetical protein
MSTHWANWVPIRQFSVRSGQREEIQVALVFEFDTTEQLEPWPRQAVHLQAQREERDEFCSECRLQVCALVRTSEFGPSEQ